MLIGISLKQRGDILVVELDGNLPQRLILVCQYLDESVTAAYPFGASG
jgi:hypothetical protein